MKVKGNVSFRLLLKAIGHAHDSTLFSDHDSIHGTLIVVQTMQFFLYVFCVWVPPTCSSCLLMQCWILSLCITVHPQMFSHSLIFQYLHNAGTGVVSRFPFRLTWVQKVVFVNVKFHTLKFSSSKIFRDLSPWFAEHGFKSIVYVETSCFDLRSSWVLSSYVYFS
jgi:hypothetical protein